MTRKRVVLISAFVLLVVATAYSLLRARSTTLVLTGIVTTNDVTVSPQIAGQIDRLLVTEGDTVTRNQLLAVIAPDELRADRAFYARSAEASQSQVRESAATLRYQERETADQIEQADSTLKATLAQHAEAAANLENARLAWERAKELSRQGVLSAQESDQARTAFEAARARLDAVNEQVSAQRASVALAAASAEQVTAKRSQLAATEQQGAAAEAERKKADVRLAYTEVRAPIAGVVDVSVARAGEVVSPGQPILTLIDPDDLWVRGDVEETYIDRLRLGDRLALRLPSGALRQGTIFFRGVDAGFATQRDVSRTKRDIKTFEVRLRTDNRDRSLAVGMTVYALLPVR